MSQWNSADLRVMNQVDELRISSTRPDGSVTRPVTIWAVEVDGHVYMRSVHGRGSGWFKGTRATGLGHVSIGGVEHDVVFTEVTDESTQTAISQAYQAKYGHYAKNIVDSTLSSDALAATITAEPR